MIADLIFCRREDARLNEGGVAAGHKAPRVKQRPGNRPADAAAGILAAIGRNAPSGTCPGQSGG